MNCVGSKMSSALLEEKDWAAIEREKEERKREWFQWAQKKWKCFVEHLVGRERSFCVYYQGRHVLFVTDKFVLKLKEVNKYVEGTVPGTGRVFHYHAEIRDLNHRHYKSEYIFGLGAVFEVDSVFKWALDNVQ